MRGNFTNHPNRNPRVSRSCVCGQVFETTQQRLDAGRGKFCSKACQYANASRPSGLKYKVTKGNPTSFAPGHEPWNKGTTGIMPEPWNKDLKGIRLSPATEFKPGNLPANWKGDDVGYFALHSWLRRAYGDPANCEHCATTERVQWANRTGLYRRDRDDWLHLCPKCHRRYDIENGLLGVVSGRFA